MPFSISLRGLPLLGGNRPDGADDPAAGPVDLGDLQLDGLAHHGLHIAALGDAGLGGGDEHPNALHIGDQAALIILGNGAFDGGLLLGIGRHLVPDPHPVQLLLGQLAGALLVVYAHHENLDLFAHMEHILGLYGRIGTDLVVGDIAGVLGAKVDLHLGSSEACHDASDLISSIQSFDGLLQQGLKALLLARFGIDDFAHFLVDLLYNPRRRRCARRDSNIRHTAEKGRLQLRGTVHQDDFFAMLPADHRQAFRIGTGAVPHDHHGLAAFAE